MLMKPTAFALFIALPVAAAVGPNTAADNDTAPASPARATFDRLATLTGTWTGRSTKGWVETVELRVIAGGSVLLETSRFHDDPEGKNAMASTYQMDGEALLLTHYCEAGNAPRLVASGFADGGKSVTFTFRDGVNLPTRDRGHMDSMILHFEDDRHFDTRWTWYRDGKSTWMEDIRYERAR
jgi:hypothetical protein